MNRSIELIVRIVCLFSDMGNTEEEIIQLIKDNFDNFETEKGINTAKKLMDDENMRITQLLD